MWATAKPAKAFIKIVKFTIIFVSIEQQDQSVETGKKKPHTFSNSEQRKDWWYKYWSTNTNFKNSSETQVLFMNEEFICVNSNTATKFKCMENVFHGNYFNN